MECATEEIIAQIDRMFSDLRKKDRNSLYSPSEFWERLGQKHIQLLKEHGFHRFKRTVNFEYHQWGVTSLLNDQFRHVLKNVLAEKEFPYVALLATNKILSHSTQAIPTKFGGFVYKLFVGLLWQYARSQDHLRCLSICEEPIVGDPLEISYKGRLISQDLALSSLELNRIIKQIGSLRSKRVAEIGAGYGRLAYVFMRTFPDIEYCIFDIPPTLAISQSYLAQTLGADRVVLYGNDSEEAPEYNNFGRARALLPPDLSRFPDKYFDLVINISSFDEMVREQITNYLDLIDRKCAGWLYLKGYTVRDGQDPSRPLGVTQFQHRERWRCVYEDVDPVQPQFVERVYDLRS